MSGTQLRILFSIKLQHQPEGAVGGGVVGTEVQEHIVLVLVATGHAPLFRFEQQVLLLHVLLGGIEHEGIELVARAGSSLRSG
ncbi:hypothetical protein ACLK16_12115 [Escherichia coli]